MAKKRKPRETEGMLRPKPARRKPKAKGVARKRAKRIAHRRRGG